MFEQRKQGPHKHFHQQGLPSKISNLWKNIPLCCSLRSCFLFRRENSRVFFETQFENHSAWSCPDSLAQHWRPWGGVPSPLRAAPCFRQLGREGWGQRAGVWLEEQNWPPSEADLGKVSSPLPAGTVSIVAVTYTRWGAWVIMEQV